MEGREGGNTLCAAAGTALCSGMLPGMLMWSARVEVDSSS